MRGTRRRLNEVPGGMGIRLGLCCSFCNQPIRFANTTATAAGRMTRSDALAKLGGLCLANARTLRRALEFCDQHGIGAFRVVSQILPLKTHPRTGYEIEELPQAAEIRSEFEACARFARRAKIRTSFHPDQFVVLNSPRPEVVAASVRELEYQAEVAEWIGADVVNIHAGGAYGDKKTALDAFERNLEQLSGRVRQRLTVENDDATYTPDDLLPVCRRTGVPLVYDVHHHRCHRDELSIEQVTQAACGTWNREPLFHVSSPIEGWSGPKPQRHHDFIAIADFPDCWRNLELTVDVEAKAKELAVLKLMGELDSSPAATPRRRTPKRKSSRQPAD